MTDRDKHAIDFEVALLSGVQVDQGDTGDALVTVDLGHLRCPREFRSWGAR